MWEVIIIIIRKPVEAVSKSTFSIISETLSATAELISWSSMKLIELILSIGELKGKSNNNFSSNNLFNNNKFKNEFVPQIDKKSLINLRKKYLLADEYLFNKLTEYIVNDDMKKANIIINDIKNSHYINLQK